MTDNPIAGYRYPDLIAGRIISGRTDLHTKQRKYGFPKPVKLTDRSAWWPKEEVDAWIKERIALRDAAAAPKPPEAAAKPSSPPPAPGHDRARRQPRKTAAKAAETVTA